MSGWLPWAEQALQDVVDAGRWRRPRTFDARGADGQLDGDRPVVSFASNDYLGLSGHPAVVEAAQRALERWGSGSGASRLITGTRPVHAELERALAEWKQTEAAVCFPTGFAANLGVLSVLGEAATRLVSDELNHASIIDGCRLARAEVAVYRHGDAEHAEALLAEAGGRSVLVTDSVFSMDGDVAPLGELAEACRRHGAALVVDEAHAVLGPELGPEVTEGLVLLRVGTLSKTLGSLGGFVAGPELFCQLLVNRARSYIFTTASSPADTAAALAALGVVHGPEGDLLRARLADHVTTVRPGHRTPIVPVVLGSEERAVLASETLLARGLWVPAIRPPTVAPGTSRLRVTLSASHRRDDVIRLREALAEFEADGALASGPRQPATPTPA